MYQSKRNNYTKKWVTVMLALFLLLYSVTGGQPVVALAGSGVITFSTRNETVNKGDVFTVVCELKSTTDFVDAEFKIEYDTDLLQFISGGSKATSSGGVVTISSTGNETLTKRKTFSLQFAALKKGVATVALSGTAKVTDAEGSAFSVSSNRLVVKVASKKATATTAPEAPSDEQVPVVTPAPAKSGKNSLTYLSVKAVSMSPAFNKDVMEYNVTVDFTTETLFMHFTAESDKAIVQFKGNDKLTIGKNEAQIIVIAENGQKKIYKLHIKKESQLETSKREEEANPQENIKDIGFSIKRKEDKIVLSNNYEFEVLNPENLESVPSGYVLTNIELKGVRVPAYTAQKDLDNNYLLMYLKGPSGEPAMYQYDRAEQTLQRYTGSMIEKINNGQIASDNSFAMNQYVVIVIIVVLVCIILVLLIALLKMTIRKKEKMEAVDDEKKIY